MKAVVRICVENKADVVGILSNHGYKEITVNEPDLLKKVFDKDGRLYRFSGWENGTQPRTVISSPTYYLCMVEA